MCRFHYDGDYVASGVLREQGVLTGAVPAINDYAHHVAVTFLGGKRIGVPAASSGVWSTNPTRGIMVADFRRLQVRAHVGGHSGPKKGARIDLNLDEWTSRYNGLLLVIFDQALRASEAWDIPWNAMRSSGRKPALSVTGRWRADPEVERLIIYAESEPATTNGR